jgi:hypothetical protein
MKKLIFALSILFGMAAAGRAQDTLKIQPFPAEQDQAVQKIDIQELPEIIKQKVASEDYSTWILQSAYKVSAKSGETQVPDSVDYIIELKKDGETIRVRFDNAGNRKADNKPED